MSNLFWLVFPWPQSNSAKSATTFLFVCFFKKTKQNKTCVFCFYEWVCLALSFVLSFCVCVFVRVSQQYEWHSWGKSPLFYFTISSLVSGRLQPFHHFHSLSLFLCFTLSFCFKFLWPPVLSCFYITVFLSFFLSFICIHQFRPFHLFLFILSYICFSACLSLHAFVPLSPLCNFLSPTWVA